MFTRFDLSPATEATIREFLRVIILAALPIVITALTVPGWTVRGVIAAVVLAALRAADKWLHERGSRWQLPV